MHRCDGCGKVVVNEQDYMCPHCGAVSRKKCDHSTHLPDDKYNRVNDYRNASAEHKSKTYEYQKTPRTDTNGKFDINDLANIKNVEDAKRVAKKAFIEQDKNGKRKFKPLAIVLIIIFAVNIFGNVLSIAEDTIDSVVTEIEDAFFDEDYEPYVEDLYNVEEIEESIRTDYDTVYSYLGSANVESATLNSSEDYLEIKLSGIGFNKVSVNMEKAGFSYEQLIADSHVVLFEVIFVTEFDFDLVSDYDDTDTVYNYADRAKFKGTISEDGVLKIDGFCSKLDEYDEDVFVEIAFTTVLTESASGIDCYNGDYNLSPYLMRFDSSDEADFYIYHSLPDDRLVYNHFEKLDLTEHEGFYLQDALEYSQVVTY